MRGPNPKIPAFTSILFLLSLFSCQPPTDKNAPLPPDTHKNFELEGLSIDELRQKMEDGTYTARQITQLYLDRIQQIDQNGPALHAVLEINPDALAIADALDKERAEHKVRGPLHGIPVLIKDNIDTGDKMQTTAGSIAMLGNRAARDAFIIQKLRDAGAIILGKTNLSEWANYRSPNSIAGWSSRGGQTKNPYVLDLSPCGSSSGSAVAVAADLCMIAVGTATDGSIGCPSSLNGIVGLKPTLGLVSCSGTIPISKTLDSPGPMARTVKDAAILLGVMAGEDPSDKGVFGKSGKSKQDYTTYLKPDGLKGKRIGVEKTMMLEKDGIGALLQKAIAQLKNNGATIVEVEFSNEYYALNKEESVVMQYEFKDGINKYLATSTSKMHSLEDVIGYNQQHESVMMPFFKQELMEGAESKGSLDSPEYKQNLSKLLSMRKYVDALMAKNNLDALCGVGAGAFGPGAITGYPTITIPMGLFEEVPYGLTFIGKPFGEPGLLTIAYGYEQVSKNRISPSYIPNFNRAQ